MKPLDTVYELFISLCNFYYLFGTNWWLQICIYVYNDMLGYWSEGILTVVIHKGFAAGHKAWFQHIIFDINWLINHNWQHYK